MSAYERSALDAARIRAYARRVASATRRPTEQKTELVVDAAHLARIRAAEPWRRVGAGLLMAVGLNVYFVVLTGIGSGILALVTFRGGDFWQHFLSVFAAVCGALAAIGFIVGMVTADDRPAPRKIERTLGDPFWLLDRRRTSETTSRGGTVVRDEYTDYS